MLFRLVLVSKNRSIYARTLHSILAFQSACTQAGVNMELAFVDDNELDKFKKLKEVLKGSDRVIWIDYGMSVNNPDVKGFFIKSLTGIDGAVFPSPVKDVVDWSAFVSEIKKGTSEPDNQVALTFDTELGSTELIPDVMNNVITTSPQIWWVDSKKGIKKINKNTPGARVLGDVFSGAKLNWGGLTFPTVHTHFTHECMGGIMNMSGVKIESS